MSLKHCPMRRSGGKRPFSFVLRRGKPRNACERSLPDHVFDTQISEVEFEAYSVKESLSHTVYQNKLDAIQAVPMY